MMKKICICFCILFLNVSIAQTNKDINLIKKSTNIDILKKLNKSFSDKYNKQKNIAIRQARISGWKTKFTTKDGRFVELQRVVDGKPIYYTTFNVNAAKSTRTDHLNSGGSLGLNLMGQNMRVHVWDAGVARASHQEYDGAGGSNRYSVGDGTSRLNYHAAHVTGTVMAAGVRPQAKGMAPHAKAVGYNWNNDKSEATSAASNGMLVSNHSYGYAARNRYGQVQLPQYFFGGYITESRAWDEIMFNAPNYLMVVAAGNDGNDNSATTNPTGGYGFDKLTGHATSKNNLVVANAQDANIDSNGNVISVTINSSSSQGPTDDFRIKPDITGNGTSVYSSYHSSNSSYDTLSGTSMASPNVTGSLTLLQQHYRNINGNFMKAATLKGLALHTADDAGPQGPDVVYGWGLLNAKRAAETITKRGNQTKIEELTLMNGQTYTITVNSDGISPLLASISWTDRPGTAVTTVNSKTPVLVNDLDIRVKNKTNTFFPYKLTGVNSSTRRDNDVDPYEKIDIKNASGEYTITVTHKGYLTGGNQNYSLIITGLKTCVKDLTIYRTINSNQTHNQSAQNTIIATNIINGGATANYDSGTSVYLKPGFHSKRSSNFRTFIKGCNLDRSIISSRTYANNPNNNEGNDVNMRISNTLEKLSIYPNPTNENISIVANKAIKSWSISTIYNKQILRGSGNVKTINTQNLPKGIYVLKVVFMNAETAIKKVVKN